MLDVTGNYDFRKYISHCKTKYVKSQIRPESVSALTQFLNVVFAPVCIFND